MHGVFNEVWMTLAGSLDWNGHQVGEQGLGASSKHPVPTALKVLGIPAAPQGPFGERDSDH